MRRRRRRRCTWSESRQERMTHTVPMMAIGDWKLQQRVKRERRRAASERLPHGLRSTIEEEAVVKKVQCMSRYDCSSSECFDSF